jgi:hypothetical protein
MFKEKNPLLLDQTSHALSHPPVILIDIWGFSIISYLGHNLKPKSAASADVADLDVGIPFYTQPFYIS